MRAVSFSENCMRESADDGPSVARYLNNVSGFQVSEYFGLGGRFRNIAFIIRCTFLVSPTVSPFHPLCILLIALRKPATDWYE